MSPRTTTRPHIGYIVHGAPGAHPGSAEVRVVRRIARGQALGLFTATFMDPVRYAIGDDLNHYDSVIVQRDVVTGELLEGVVARARQRGARLVFEVDDDFVTDEARKRLLAAEYDEARLDAVRRMAGEADVVIVSTERLAETMRQFARSTVVVPNELDPAIWPSPPSAAAGSRDDADETRVVYVGSATHALDLALLRPVFDGLTDSHGRPIVLEVVGVTGADEPWFTRLEIPAGSHPYPSFVAWLHSHRSRWAFGVAPLADVEFNASKSDLKFLEYSMLGLATIASESAAYGADREHGALVVPQDAAAWRATIVALADDPGEVRRRAEIAASYVQSDRMLGDLGFWRSVVLPPRAARLSRVRDAAALARHPSRLIARLRPGTVAPTAPTGATPSSEGAAPVSAAPIEFTDRDRDRPGGVTRVVVDTARVPEADSWTSAANALLDGVATRYAVVLDADVEAQALVDEALLRVAEETGAAFVQPVVTDGSGLIVDAGSVFVSRGAPPLRVLAEHPLSDLPPGDRLDVGVLTSRCVLVDLHDFGGFDPGYSAEEGIARATAARSPVVALKVVVTDEASRVPTAARSAWRGHTTGALASPGLASVVALSGLRLEGVQGSAVPDLRERIMGNDFLAATRSAKPVLAARPGAPLRWSIRSGAPSGEAGRVWGDTYFAEDLAAALRARGQRVVVETRDTAHRAGSDYLDDVTVTLRGLHIVPPNPAAFNILWVISHPELVGVDELESYDLVYAAGPAWGRRMAGQVSVPVLPLLQATSPERFHPGPRDASLVSDVLFVGKTRNVYRPIVRDALAVGAKLAVYGDGWEQFIDPSLVRSQFLANDDVSAAYRSARIVLNDHWADMRGEGFLANRLFDAVASGARVVTDEIDGLEIFGGAVRPYSGQAELARLLHDDDGWPDDDAIAVIARRVAAEHSFGARADELISAVRECSESA